MTIDDLVRAGDKLVRPCTLLNPGDGSIAGYWGGERADDPNGLPPAASALRSKQHLLTLDHALLAGEDAVAGSLGLYLYEDGNGAVSVRVTHSPLAVSDLQCSGEPLVASQGLSYPPFEALCLYGDEKVAGWLGSLGFERHQYDLAAGEALAADYTDHYLERSAFHVEACDAIAGGWHVRWPEDDFYMPLEMRLVVTTLRDAEPFWEVWQSATGNFSTRERIS